MARFRAMPYAKALFEVMTATDPGRMEEVASELDRVAETVATVPEFLRALTTPTVPVENKSEILDAVLDALKSLNRRVDFFMWCSSITAWNT